MNILRATIVKTPRASLLFFAALALALVGIVAQIMIFFAISVICFLLLGFSHIYLLIMKQGLGIHLECDQYKLFPNEKLKLKVQLLNTMPISMTDAEWKLRISKRLVIEELEYKEGKIANEYSAGFTLGSKQGLEYQWEAKAIQRGIASLSDMTITIRDPFGFGQVVLELRLPIQEVTIYPELRSIGGLGRIQLSPMGDRSVSLMTHEDPTLKVGARPYLAGDPFSKIDWKTTARKQELHTKILDRTAHTELVIIGNVRSYAEHWRGIDHTLIERTLSVVGSLAHYAVLQKIPFQSILNMKPVGKPIYQVPKGEGRRHLSLTLEALARVSVFSTLSFEEAAYYAYREYSQGKVYIFVTPYVTPQLQSLLEKMRRENIPVFLVDTENEVLELQRMQREGRRYA